MNRYFLFVLWCVLFSSVEGIAREAYAVYQEGEYEEWQTEFSNKLTFYYDDNKDQWWSGYVYSLNEGDTPPGWYSNSELEINEIVFDASFADARPISTAYWFAAQDYSNLKNIYGLQYLKTSEVTNMSHMFYNCKNLTALDLSSFDTSNVNDMSFMFHNCQKLQTLDISSFYTYNVTNMANMFYGCNSLTALDVSGFNTGNVTDMSNMFYGCYGLVSLGLGGFNTAKVTNMELMFYNCKNLTNLNLGSFETSNVTNMRYMFDNCNSLVTLNLSSFDTGKVTDMSNMFSRCNSLKSINLTRFNTVNVVRMDAMFYLCSSLTSLDVSSFDSRNVTNMESMFEGCSSLTNLDLDGLVTSSVTNMRSMFLNCRGLTTIDLSGFDTRNVTSMENLFMGCSGLTSLDLSPLNTGKVTTMWQMFLECSGLSSLDLSSLDTHNVTKMYGMFMKCTNLKCIDMTGLNMDKVKDIRYMFNNCSNLRCLDLSTFDMTKAKTSNSQMFTNMPVDGLLYLPKGAALDDFTGNNLSFLNKKKYNLILTDADGNSTCEDFRLFDNKMFDVTSPFLAVRASYDRAFSDGETTTVYLPFPFKASQFGTVYRFVGLNEVGTCVRFLELSGETKANTPYLIEPNGTKISAASVLVATWVSTPITGADEMIGVIKDTLMPADAYEFDGSVGNVKKIPADAAVDIKAARGYFLLPNADGSALDVVFGQGLATGVTNAGCMTETSGRIYNLQGQRVKTTAKKGLYIVNGKIIVK